MSQLSITCGQCSSPGRKPVNQDFHAVSTPSAEMLSLKGIVVALADGISSSEVSQQASQTAVTGFIEDYYATPESWPVKTSAQRVLQATNSWLYAQTRNGPYRYEMDKGYVCTFSALIIKSTTAHIFHAGDSRILRISGGAVEQLTEDHRVWVSREKSYLSRALGMRDWLDADYLSLGVEVGEIFLLATDGVYEFCAEAVLTSVIKKHADDLQRAAELIVEHALQQGSDDNLTIQIVRIDALPQHDVDELQRHALSLPLPPSELRPGSVFDGYEIIRDLHNSSRSHVYLAQDTQSGERVVLKIPSVDLRYDHAFLEHFLMEDWVARRVDSVHLLKPAGSAHRHNFLYLATEFVEGQTLRQWMIDNPEPELRVVRDIIGQIARGLQTLHRQEMLHQDIRPENIMIDQSGTVKIIDFGSVEVAGVIEMLESEHAPSILGTAQYSAPEYFVGEAGSWRADLYSLAVMAYEMLSGRLPYGPQVARATTYAAQRRLCYDSVLDAERSIPLWIDGALRKAVHPDPYRRQDSLSEFIYDLSHPNAQFLRQTRAPLLERNPLLFWKGLSLVLLVGVIGLSILLHQHSLHP